MAYPIRTFEYAVITNAVDGDTCDIEVDLGFSVKVKHRFRLARINTPERGQPGWQEATDFLKSYVGVPLNRIEVTKLDKYGRYLAELYATPALSINQLILDKHLGVLYE
jgi:micrococcal nuclease